MCIIFTHQQLYYNVFVLFDISLLQENVWVVWGIVRNRLGSFGAQELSKLVSSSEFWQAFFKSWFHTISFVWVYCHIHVMWNDASFPFGQFT